MILSACQTHPNTPAITEDEPAISTTNQPPANDREPADMSSATANADGSPIIFDPWEAGRNLPDPCRELPNELLQKIGFTGKPYRLTHGLNDELPGKGITCDLDLADNYDGYRTSAIYTDTLSREYLEKQGLIIGDAPESIVPNSYYYTFSPSHPSVCYIGTSTHRGRISLNMAGRTDWPQEKACQEARKYFDKFYIETSEFSWIKGN
ncbi:hypothetical protein [Corynebacterium sp. CCM 9203]|uniref:hypothetical protein n=1 Tax=Corynebacterium sp. CCM 9203 TaxID=3057615 RepID=UPI0035269700